jgi:hypothetical protein
VTTLQNNVTLRIIWPNFWHNWPKLAERIASYTSAEVMILITGATGTNGMQLIKLLAREGIGVRALVRSPDRASAIAHLPGVALMIAISKTTAR